MSSASSPSPEESLLAATGLTEPGLDPIAESTDQSSGRGGRLKRLLLLGVLAAVGGAIMSKLRQRQESDNWQSSYVPTPPPTPASDPAGSPD